MIRGCGGMAVGIGTSDVVRFEDGGWSSLRRFAVCFVLAIADEELGRDEALHKELVTVCI
jgi:hypothetical protein